MALSDEVSVRIKRLEEEHLHATRLMSEMLVVLVSADNLEEVMENHKRWNAQFNRIVTARI